MKFSFYNPTTIQFGQGQIASISTLIEKDKKVLVLYGGGSIKKNGVYDQVEQALDGYTWETFGGVEPNPTRETLDKAVEQMRTSGLDFILAVGGGSVIDGAKYVAAAACYDGDGWDILIGKHTVTKALPIGAVLTLPATGSESNCASVVSNKATLQKLPFMAPSVFPKFAVLDPDVVKSLPEKQVVNGVVDAFVHVCEQYLTFPQNAPVQDGYAETLLRTLVDLGNTIEQKDDVWRANLMWTANQALNGLIGSGVAQDWATHMIGHELTALYGVDHARSLAIVQPALLKVQLDAKKAKLEQMGQKVFGLAPSETLALDTIDAIAAFYNGLNVSTSLTEHNESKEEAIEAVISQLEKNKMVALGESQAITPEVSRSILDLAVAG
ncbi:iron-containing alcohol dehydrogenase [Alteromonas sp. KUL49]|uniref:iron-containing alcohol dehydrogenase n=1 Tax=Alteromonas sp. KUL49 TaxID=2480798 RepID=UPI00102F0ED8|nr:iron-containing alcohol dehydrogenase [Alteromonas sp. KUL49]TAP38853.1 iron-containing alcohol dehydrogenase [Alteromonas sp. KUL49]GEA12285.1 NADH-dependent alcohol dehydrogenase [Alteromonas sp. KUL49]